MAFREWVATRYDPAALTAEYRSGGAADFVVDRVLGPRVGRQRRPVRARKCAALILC